MDRWTCSGGPIMLYYRMLRRCVAQLGRALRSGRRGRRFKSCRIDPEGIPKGIPFFYLSRRYNQRQR